MKRTVWAAVAALLVLGFGAPAAFADSIAYIKDGNVWLSTADGSRQYQVTSTGRYADVSQADDGTMIALTGTHLHKLARDGTVQADFTTPVSDDRPAPQKTFFGPFDPAISPDGTKVAYTFYWMTQTQSPTCFPPTCVIGLNEGGTAYSYPDRLTDWKEPGLGYHTGWGQPVWVDNDMTILSNPTHAFNADVILDRVSDGGNGHGNMVMNWFSDVNQNPRVGGADITRDKRKLAMQTGPNDNYMTVYSVNSFPTRWKDGDAVDSNVTRCYRYEKPEDQKYGIPTWSPDGARLAWHEADGIHIVPVPDFSNGCTLDGVPETAPLVLAGGTNPDWGPADVPAPRPTAPAPPPQTQPAPNTTSKQASKSLSAQVTGKPTRRSGVTVKVKAPGKGKLTAIAKQGAKTVGKATKAVKKAGTTSLKLRVKAKGTVTVKVTFKPTKGTARTKTLKIKVR